MSKLRLVVDNVMDEDVYLKFVELQRDKFIKTMISVNPVYDWFEENVGFINYKLLKAFMTNIVPLGDNGKAYFKKLAHRKNGFTIELWKLYNNLEMLYKQGKLKKVSYLELYNLGYEGIWLGGICPVDDITDYKSR
jgi:hypothetical protein